MSTNVQTTTKAAVAETPQALATLSPEALVEQLRALRAQIGAVTPLTAAQRRTLLDRTRTPNQLLQASINVIDAAETISGAIGQPAAEVRQLHDEANRWTAVEDELKVMLKGVTGANLVRRERVAFLASQAAGLGAQLARDPAHAALLPHVQEIKRLRGLTRRKKADAKKVDAKKTTDTKKVPDTSSAPDQSQSSTT